MALNSADEQWNSIPKLGSGKERTRWRRDGKENEMKGERTIVDKPFRFAGLMKDYDKTADEWAEVHPKYMSRCYICGGSMRNVNSLPLKSYPYVGLFSITKGKHKGQSRFHVMCRACAYDLGKGVVEMDGYTYTDKYAFKESRFKEALSKGICWNCKHLKRHNGELAEYVCDIKGAVVSDTRIRECDDMWGGKNDE